jgi:hypothetical protein
MRDYAMARLVNWNKVRDVFIYELRQTFDAFIYELRQTFDADAKKNQPQLRL